MDPRYDDLLRLLGEISDLGRARALLAWDERTHMPPGGAEARAEQVATLSRIRHDRLRSDELGRLLDQVRPHAESLPYDSDEASLVRVTTREWEKARRVPSELRAEIARASSLGERAWVEAKARSDFAGFIPHLERVIALQRRYLECFAPFDHPYDPLLDDFEPGLKTAEIGPVLEQLRDGLRPLIEKIAEREDAVDDSCLYGEDAFPVEAQARLARRIVEGLPLPGAAWRLDRTVHPFASAIAKSDIRLTTRFDPSYVGAGVWAVIHEAGHGIYENGVAPELARTPLAGPPSLGLHESQSRLWENWVGRGRPYLRHLQPLLAEAFPEKFGEVDSEGLYRAANRVQRSLIRVEADEVTYNLHIIIRFELERELMEGKLSPAELRAAWNARYEQYLGLEVPDNARGVLQDVHWAAGSFGYFPTYSLGNVIAAQIWEVASRALPDLDAQLERGELAPLRDFLRERLYRHGGKFMTTQMLERAIGGSLNTRPLLRHLSEKFGAIYGF